MLPLLRVVSGWRSGRILRSRAGSEAGVVLVLVVLFLPVLLSAMGLVLDVAYLFWVRTSLQAAVDMGALAGAQNVDLEALGGGERRILIEPAVADARRWVTQNADSWLTTGRHRDLSVGIEVYNAAPDQPLHHRWSGREITEPTVAVWAAVFVKPFFIASVVPEVHLVATADASLLEKADPLPP